MLDGVEHCHKKGIVHRDLKCKNLLFNEEFTVKVADFGTHKMIEDKDPYTEFTPAYAPP